MYDGREVPGWIIPGPLSSEHRQQLKWLYSGAAIFVVWLLIGVFIVPVAMGEAPRVGHPAGGRCAVDPRDERGTTWWA